MLQVMTYKKAEIEDMFPRIKRGRLQEWLREGYITPYQPATQGQTALFDRTNIYQIVLFDELIKAGALREDAARMVGYLQSHKYIIKTEKPVKPPLRSSGGFGAKNEIPAFKPGTYKTFLIIDIQAIKTEVDSILG
jgi:hypothetical protein